MTRGDSGRRVRALVAGRVTFEVGSPADPADRPAAVLAHWSPVSQLSRSVEVLVGDLQSHGYRVVIASSCESPEPLIWDAPLDRNQLVVLRKPNLGYDFGSWSVALAALPDVAASDQVILLNDSMVGPFTSLRPLLEEFERTRADVWGLTDTQQFAHHLQSYFLGFRGGILNDRPLRDFWAGISHETDKDRIIFRNEIGLSQLLRDEGYVVSEAFPHESVVEPGLNPVIKGWRQLLERGFPFLKREILRDPAVAPDGASAPAVVQQLFGVDVFEWVTGAAA